MDFSVKLAEFTLEHPIMNAAGLPKLVEHIRDLANSEVSAVVAGGITWDKRDGNEGNNFWFDDFYALNSLGLPNLGREYYHQHLPEMAKICHDAGKPLIVNVNGFNSDDFKALVELVYEGGADLAEVNFACPNLWDKGNQKRIFSCYPDLMGEILEQIKSLGKKISVKRSPQTNPMVFSEEAHVYQESGIVVAVVCCNTFPNALLLDPQEKPRIPMKLGGLSSKAMLPICLGQVAQLHAAMPDIPIVGVGGISCGQDVLDYQHAGATVVQVGTEYFKTMKPRESLSRIGKEYLDLVDPPQ